MNTHRLNPIAEDYLARLDSAASVLPVQDRDDLVLEVRSHLEAGLAAGDSDADVRNLLHDLGSPEEIVAAATQETDSPQRPPDATLVPPGPSPWGALEIAAVLCLTLGAIVVPFVGPLLGVCFAWVSERWTRREKIVATVLGMLPLVTLALGAAVATSRGPSLPVEVPSTQLIAGVTS